MSRASFLVSLVLVSLSAPVALGQPAQKESAALEFFEKKVRPVLVENCYNCHSANTNSRGGLRVDDRNGLLAGGNSGPAVVPGHPEKSLLFHAVRYRDDAPKMPPKKQLAPEQIADLSKWIADGAVWPKTNVPTIVGKPNKQYARLRQTHWAWQPLRVTSTPAVRDGTWPRSAIDRFVLASLEEKNLRPVADADRLTLLRRVTFDLVGLPPTPAEIDAFLQDRSALAFEKVVDRLLASSAFGERWGRHWLDVARYGESTGSSRNLPLPQAWRYRDYVIDSFHADKPYDRFIVEQIAGDLLPAETPKQRDTHLTATGFLALGVKDVNQRFKVRYIMDNIDEQIDTVTRSVLGLTASCARCHDHKFDPIPQTDYYALAGIFHSTDLCAGLRNKMGGGGLDYYDHAMLLRLGGEKPRAADAKKVAALTQEVAAAKAAFEAVRGTPEGLSPGADGKPKQQALRLKMVKLQGDLLALTDPAADGLAVLGVRDGKKVGDTELRIRGEAEKLGPVVPRGFLSLLPVEGAAAVNPMQSGRLELARWLTSDKNPLTPRVMANRVWHHLFGAGLVASVDNFGVTGEAPSHPELLDHLAAQFVRDGWSVKKLVRTVVLSRAYQLSGDAPRTHTAIDPGNRLIWRHSPRRLSAEEMRDAMLTAAGTLDRNRAVGSPAMTLKVIELANNNPEAQRIREAARTSRQRSVYLPLVRLIVPGTLEVFDPAEQGMVSGSRDATTVAPQALYLLNDPWVMQQARTLSEELLGRADLEDGERITTAYRRSLGRGPAAREVERALAFLADYESAARQEDVSDPRAAAWASLCQALFGSAEFRYLR